MSADNRPLVEDSIDLEGNYELASQEWEREDEFYGKPPAVMKKLSKRIEPTESPAIDSTGDHPRSLRDDDQFDTISVSAFAKSHGIGRSTVYDMVRRGEIPSERYRGRIVIPKSAQWIPQHEPESTPDEKNDPPRTAPTQPTIRRRPPLRARQFRYSGDDA